MLEHVVDLLPPGPPRQMQVLPLVRKSLTSLPTGANVLDLGSGRGVHLNQFLDEFSHLNFYGADIPSSNEASTRRPSAKLDPLIFYFDGKKLPFEDGFFDFVYSIQVLEHVEYPDALLTSLSRTMKRDAIFAGSASCLEAYHSNSLWCFTAYGLKKLFERNGFVTTMLAPGIDGLTLVERSLIGPKEEYAKFFSETSPQHARIMAKGVRRRRRREIIFSEMLRFSGHLLFSAKKTE